MLFALVPEHAQILAAWVGSGGIYIVTKTTVEAAPMLVSTTRHCKPRR